MQVNIPTKIGMEMSKKLEILLKCINGIDKLSIRISGARTRAIRNVDKFLSLSDSIPECKSSVNRMTACNAIPAFGL
jgi:hypothetical protein